MDPLPALGEPLLRRPFAKTFLDVLGVGACVLILASVVFWLRWPDSNAQQFRGEEVAGMAYGADLLSRGKIPVVDSVETKGPLAPFLVYGAWKMEQRSVSAIHEFSVFWALMAALGVFWLGRLLWGVGSGLVAGVIYAIGSPPVDGMTLSYAACMITPTIWAMVFLVEGLRNNRGPWFVASGIFTSIALLLNHCAILLMVVLFVVLVTAPRLRQKPGWQKSGYRASVLYLTGALLGFAPVVTFFLFVGGLGEFLNQFLFSPWSFAWIGQDDEWKSIFNRLDVFIEGFWKFLAIPTYLGCLAFATVRMRRTGKWTSTTMLLVLLLVAGFANLFLWFRFIPGDYVFLLLAISIFAGHPDGPVLRWFNRQWPRGVYRLIWVGLILCLALSLVPAVLWQIETIDGRTKMGSKTKKDQLEAGHVGKTVKARTSESDCIWTWGIAAWSVYFHSERVACSRYYKSLDLITTPSKESWKTRSNTFFKKQEPWEEISNDLLSSKPSFIVAWKKQSFRGWTEISDLLRKEYKEMHSSRFKGFRVYEKKGGNQKDVSKKGKPKHKTNKPKHKTNKPKHKTNKPKASKPNREDIKPKTKTGRPTREDGKPKTKTGRPTREDGKPKNEDGKPNTNAKR